MEKKTYKYRAFISYRQLNPDKKIAKRIHAMLESYVIPKSLRGRTGRKLGRIFVDNEELAAAPDLGEAIEDALRDSECLIVICSPRTPSSKWINKEIDQFYHLGRKHRVIPVLIQGNPESAFPNQFRVLNEPLAADLRDEDSQPSLKRLQKEGIHKIVAAILCVNYDDLKQRFRRQKRIFFTKLSSVIFVGSIIIASIYRSQRNQIAMQLAAKLENQAKLLWTDPSKFETATLLAAEAALIRPSKDLDNILRRAIKLVPKAVDSKYSIPAIPTSKSLDLSDNSQQFLSVTGKYQLSVIDDLVEVRESRHVRLAVKGEANLAQFSRDDRYIALANEGTGYVQIYDLASGKKLTQFSPKTSEKYYGLHYYGTNFFLVFSPDSRYLATSIADSAIIVYDLDENLKCSEINAGEPEMVQFNSTSRWLLTYSAELIRIWNLNGDELFRLPFSGRQVPFSSDEKYLIVKRDHNQFSYDLQGEGLHFNQESDKRIIAAAAHQSRKVFATLEGENVMRYDEHLRKIGGIKSTPDVQKARLSPDLSMILAISENDCLIFDFMKFKKPLAVFQGILDADWIDQTRVLLLNSNGKASIRNVYTGAVSMIGRDKSYSGLALNNTKQYAALFATFIGPNYEIADIDSVDIYETSNGERLFTDRTQENFLRTSAWAPTNCVLTTSIAINEVRRHEPTDATVRLIDVPRRTQREWILQTNVTALAVDNNASFVLAGTQYEGVYVLESRTNSHIATIPTEGEVSVLKMSANGKLVAAGDSQGNVYVWRYPGWRLFHVLKQTGRISEIFFSNDNSYLTSVSPYEVHIWKLRTKDLVSDLCSRLKRSLTEDEWRTYVGNFPYRRTCSGV